MKPYCGHDMLLFITLFYILNVGSMDITMKIRLEPTSDYLQNVTFNSTSFKHFAGCLCNKRAENCSVYYSLNGIKALGTVGSEKNDMEILKDNVYKCSVDQVHSKVFCRRSTNHSIPCLSLPLCQSISLLSPLTCGAGCIGFLWNSTRESLEHKAGIQPCDPGLNGSTPKTPASKPILSHTTAWLTTVTTKPATLTSTKVTNITTTSTTSSSLSTTAIGNVTNNNQTQTTNDEDGKTAIIIGVTVALIIIIALTIIVVLIWRWRKHHKHSQNDKTTSSERVQTSQSPYNLNGFSSNGAVNGNTGYTNQINPHQNRSTNPYEYASTDPERFENFTSNPYTTDVDDDNNDANIDDSLVDDDFGYSTVNKLGTVKADTRHVYTKLGDKVKNITDPYDALLDPSEIPSPGQSSDKTSFQQVEQDLRRDQMSEEETNKEAAEPEYSVVMKKGRRPN